MEINTKKICKITGTACVATGIVCVSAFVASGTAVVAIAEGFKTAGNTIKKILKEQILETKEYTEIISKEIAINSETVEI